MIFISLFPILVRKEHLAKMNNHSKRHGAGPLKREAQCSRIGWIGLRSALFGSIPRSARETFLHKCLWISRWYDLHQTYALVGISSPPRAVAPAFFLWGKAGMRINRSNLHVSVNTCLRNASLQNSWSTELVRCKNKRNVVKNVLENSVLVWPQSSRCGSSAVTSATLQNSNIDKYVNFWLLYCNVQKRLPIQLLGCLQGRLQLIDHWVERDSTFPSGGLVLGSLSVLSQIVGCFDREECWIHSGRYKILCHCNVIGCISTNETAGKLKHSQVEIRCLAVSEQNSHNCSIKYLQTYLTLLKWQRS